MDEKIAADFTLIDQHGNEFNLYKNLNKKVLLFFYPKDDTPVCSAQLRDYSSSSEEFEKEGITIAAVNYEDQNSHRKFCEKNGLSFPVLSDKSKTVAKKYGALNLLGMPKRKAVLINTDRKIIYEKNMLPISYTKSDTLLKEILHLNLFN